MLQGATTNLKPRFGRRVWFVRAVDAALPFHEAFNAIFSTATFHWVPDHPRLFVSLIAALRPGGRLVAQCGGGPNLARLLGRAAALAATGRFVPHLVPARRPGGSRCRCPDLGVNLGKVGFLSKVEAHDFEHVLDQVPAGDVEVRERMMLEAITLPRGERVGAHRSVAMNDVVVARGALARVCHLQVSVRPSHVGTFIADGLVVASPTGSTGYSFSAGGPIVEPTSRALIVTPIAAYLSTLRSIVVPPGEVVRTVVVSAHEALVSIDGREDRPLAVGDVVEVRALERPIRFIEPRGAIPFWELLRQKVELLPS